MFQTYPDTTEIKAVKEFLLKIKTQINSDGQKMTPLALSESRSFLEEFNIISKNLGFYGENFLENTLSSGNPIGMDICLKVQNSLLLTPEELAKIFETSINKIAKKLGIDTLEGDNLLEKMNALIEAANDSSINLDDNLKTDIKELRQFLIYAQEIAKFDVEWNDKIIAWDAKLETLNNNSLFE